MVGYGITDHRAAEPGAIIGWAAVDPSTMRFASFASPNTGQRITGLCLALMPESIVAGAPVGFKPGRVWINDRNGWRRAAGWMERAFLERLEADKKAGTISTDMHFEEGAEQA